MLRDSEAQSKGSEDESFNGHPPLGVNATKVKTALKKRYKAVLFQWAPTLGGECYIECDQWRTVFVCGNVSMGTHPWG